MVGLRSRKGHKRRTELVPCTSELPTGHSCDSTEGTSRALQASAEGWPAASQHQPDEPGLLLSWLRVLEVYLAAACPEEGCLVLLAAETSRAAQGSAWCFMETFRAGGLSTEAAWGSGDSG